MNLREAFVHSKQNQPWIPTEKVELFVQLEPALIILGLALGAWVISKIFLRSLSEDRLRNLRGQFQNLSYHLFLGIILFLTYVGLSNLPNTATLILKLAVYTGLATILSGAVVFVKVSRILLFEYLYLSHMKVAFPVLLVNLFTLLLSVILGSWIGAEIFNIRLAPILATSAIFSLVLGLALQDTLGNLFAGVALQFDKPYEIGDWIEIQSSGSKWIGRVHEISWRATVLTSFTHELITVPNRVVAQAQIANFSNKYSPIIRSQVFRLPFETPISEAKNTLIRVTRSVSGIRKNPPPSIFISETTESWIGFKVIYYIDNYGDQFRIADEVFTKGLALLEEDGFKLATHRVSIIQ